MFVCRQSADHICFLTKTNKHQSVSLKQNEAAVVKYWGLKNCPVQLTLEVLTALFSFEKKVLSIHCVPIEGDNFNNSTLANNICF